MTRQLRNQPCVECCDCTYWQDTFVFVFDYADLSQENWIGDGQTGEWFVSASTYFSLAYPNVTPPVAFGTEPAPVVIV